MATVYEIVTQKIIEKLEQGNIPWRKPWNSYPAINWVTQKPYSGVNQLLLDPGEYATWNQVQAAKGRVKKGAKSEIVVFWKVNQCEEITDGEGGEKATKTKTVPILRYYRVFNIKDCEGLEPKQKIEQYTHNPIEEAEKIAEGYPNGPRITFAPNVAFYNPVSDTVSIPEKADFGNIAEYYATLFHELIHSTGHERRLNRITKQAAFGSHEYSKEELVAEVGSAMLCGQVGIEITLDNSTAYIKSWLQALNDDKTMIVHAASQAQKAADYITGSKGEQE